MIGNTYLELKLLKNPLLKLSAATIKSLIKSLKNFQNSVINKFTSPLLILSNIIISSTKYNLKLISNLNSN